MSEGISYYTKVVKPQPSVSVVIGSYRRPDSLLRVLQSVAAQSLSPIEVIVVDNQSDQSERIRSTCERFPSVRLVALPDNAGFARAMNEGLKCAKGEYVLFLCDDVILEPKCVEYLIRAIQSEAEAGLVTGTLVQAKSGNIQCRGISVSLGRNFHQTLRYRDYPVSTPPLEPHDVGVAPGGFCLGRRLVLDRLGGFRGDFYMYFEDVEFSLRIARAGYRVIAVPQAFATDLHLPHEFAGRRVGRSKARNLLSLYLIYAEPRIAASVIFRYGWWQALRRVVSNPPTGVMHLLDVFLFTLQIPKWVRERYRLEGT